MYISFFAETEFMKSIGKELQLKGHIVEFNSITNPEIVVAMGHNASYNLSKVMPAKFKFKLVNTVLDIPFWRINNPVFKKTYDGYKSFIEKGNVTSISKWTSSELKRIWKIDSVPLFFEFNNKGVDSVPVIPEEDKLDQILMVGRFIDYKKFEVGIEAVSLMVNEPKLVLIGNGDDNLYKYLAKQYNVDLKVIQKADDETVFTEMKKSKVLLHPSIFEGKSMVPKEAIWGNTNVVISDIPVHREFHKNVSFFNPMDLEDLVIKLDEIYNKKFNEKSKKEIEKFTIEKVAKKAEKYLEVLI